MKKIIVSDFGTSAVKSFLYNVDDGCILGVEEAETNYFSKELGAVETHANYWFEGFKSTIKELLKKHGSTDVEGIAITNQQISCVFLDEYANPVHEAILWMDTRSKTDLLELKNKHEKDSQHKSIEDWFISQTGIPFSDSWGLAKLLWLKNKHPEKYRRVRKIASVDAYISYKLTGQFKSDESNACFFNLDLKSKKTNESVLKLLDINENVFPQVVPPGSNIGMIKTTLIEEFGLNKQIPVILSGSDQPCSMVGMGAIRPGEVVINLGSGSFVLTPLEIPITDRKIMTNVSVIPNQWIAMGTHYLTGSAFRWLRDLLALKSEISYKDLDKMAGNVKPGSDGVIFIPSLSGSGTPYWDSDAKGVFAGLTLKHTPGHLSRAIMESTGYGLKVILKTLDNLGIMTSKIIMSGGATVSPVWSQSITNILDADIELSNSKQATSLGAFIIASVSLGYHRSIEAAVNKYIQQGKILKPDPETKKIYKKGYNEFLYWREAEQDSRNCHKKEKSIEYI